MSDREKYSDQHGRKHDSMLGAQWADEEIDRKSSGSGDSDSKLIGFTVLLYIGASFISSIQFIVLLVDRKFARSGAGFSLAMAFFVVMAIFYFWGMMKFKTDSVPLYCCLAAGAMCLVSYWLPPFW